MLNTILFTGVFVCNIACDVNNSENNNHGVKYLSQQEVYYQYTQCTRRFSPGVCSTPVRPVWTFAFPLQNCTERLGCPRDPRANRFMSYSRCMRHCQGLIDLYTHILASGNNNVTMLRSDNKIYNSSRREGEGISEISLYEDKEENHDHEDDITLESLNFLEAELPRSDSIHENMELELFGNVDNHDV